MLWVLWQDTTHGEALRVRYRKTYDKDADEEDEDMDDVDPFETENSKDGDGDEEPTRAQSLHRKFRLAAAYLGELSEEEQARLRNNRETDFINRRRAYEKALGGETECTAEELEE
jgi:hypothetical protein